MKLQVLAVAIASFVGWSGAAPPSLPTPSQLLRLGGQAESRPKEPATDGASERRFALTQVENENYHGPDPLSGLLRAYGRYKQTLPPALEKAIQINPELSRKFKSLIQQDGKTSVNAYPAPMYDSQYVVPVQIGTPPQRTYLNLDTGSSDFWTFSTDTYPAQSDGHTLYQPAQSNTSKRLDGQSWNIRYGDGAYASGIVYTDRVQLGGTSFDAQTVQAPIQVSFDITDDKFSSGILGMAMSSANTVRPDKQKTYIDNIKDELDLPLFTANLQKGKPGTYDFGYIDNSQFTGSIHYTPIEQDSPFWKFNVSGYQVGKDGRYNESSFPAIVDTGTTLLLVPSGITKDYYSRVKGAALDPSLGMTTFPCSSQLPDFTFAIGPYKGKIPGHYMNYTNSNSTHCYGGIQSSDGIGMAILGDILIKAQFIVFDLGAKRLGFANKKTLPP